MKEAGQVVLFRCPQTDMSAGKLRPALMLSKLPGDHDDWLICMISSQMHQFVKDFDEIILGTTGEIEKKRLHRVKDRLANWIQEV
jgi:mRNA interferase MazF